MATNQNNNSFDLIMIPIMLWHLDIIHPSVSLTTKQAYII